MFRGRAVSGGGSLIAPGDSGQRGWLTYCSGGEGSAGVSLIARLLVLEACVVPACAYGTLLFLSQSIYNRTRL